MEKISFTTQEMRDLAQLSKEEIIEILHGVSKILDCESKLVEIQPSKVFFLGDTHGNFPFTIHALKHLFPVPGESHTRFDKVVFLGDFIDRGLYSIENVNLLMYYKYHYPERLILIRGNHETREINMRFDFYENVMRKYGLKVFELYNQIFSKLPLAILTWNQVFAVHGGIPEGLENLNDLNGLEDEINPTDRITFQILWNDPVEKDGWFFKNFRGQFSKRFGREAFHHFMEKHQIKLFLRAHEVQKEGVKEYFDTQLISLDSSQKKRKLHNMKVFILHQSGEHEIREVEDFETF